MIVIFTRLFRHSFVFYRRPLEWLHTERNNQAVDTLKEVHSCIYPAILTLLSGRQKRCHEWNVSGRLMHECMQSNTYLRTFVVKIYTKMRRR